jgi:hypothetical protein
MITKILTRPDIKKIKIIKMNYLFSRSLFFLILALPFKINAQQVYTLDLRGSIELAKEKSKTMLILKERIKGASYNLEATISQYRTHVNLSFLIPQYTETIRQWEDSSGISFFPVRQNLVNGNLVITQPLPTDGNLFIRSGIQNLIDYYDNNRSAQITSSIGLRQPIEAFFAELSVFQFLSVEQTSMNRADFSFPQKLAFPADNIHIGIQHPG